MFGSKIIVQIPTQFFRPPCSKKLFIPLKKKKQIKNQKRIMSMVILSASVKRFSVSPMRDFKLGVGERNIFVWGWSKLGERLLQMGLPCLVKKYRYIALALFYYKFSVCCLNSVWSWTYMCFLFAHYYSTIYADTVSV